MHLKKHRKISVTKESGSLTQAARINYYWDKSLITFNPIRRFCFKGTKVNLYLSTLQRSYEDSLNTFKVFLHFKQIFSPSQTM